MKKETFLVTGGAGFIGTNFVRLLKSERPEARIVVLDSLSYAGNIKSLADLIETEAILFHKADIRNREAVDELLSQYEPDYVINFAAESHVDRSVDDPSPFISTNIEGTFTLLEACRKQRKHQQNAGKTPTLRRFVQISTDEVYGDLEIGKPVELDGEQTAMLGRSATLFGDDTFTEETPLNPSSPYSASKASADMLALSYVRSFGMPVIVTRCSNNYGPYQFPEKLIPLAINNLYTGKAIPVYGTGENIRDWIHVDDHCRGVLAAALKGTPGKVYNFGGYNELSNINLVKRIIRQASELLGREIGPEAIQYVSDRPGHDRRYAINASRSMRELGWRPLVSIEEGLRQTVQWNIANRAWIDDIVNGEYRNYYAKMYTNR
ncbi:MAG: dTDP-glucose 4,6-dehydratase [Muribaculaceae bacterium]|nr:dTDP-glucose 4,6-dehydratase [Muribaculaceae bacterium]